MPGNSTRKADDTDDRDKRFGEIYARRGYIIAWIGDLLAVGHQQAFHILVAKGWVSGTQQRNRTRHVGRCLRGARFLQSAGVDAGSRREQREKRRAIRKAGDLVGSRCGVDARRLCILETRDIGVIDRADAHRSAHASWGLNAVRARSVSARHYGNNSQLAQLPEQGRIGRKIAVAWSGRNRAPRN